MTTLCPYCQALRFEGEALKCCHDDKASLPSTEQLLISTQRAFESGFNGDDAEKSIIEARTM